MTVTVPRVLVFSDEPEHYTKPLMARLPNLVLDVCVSYDELPAKLEAFKPTVILGCKFEPKPWPRAALLNCPDLQWLSVTAAGVEHVAPWDDKALTVTNFSGIAATEMAHYVLAGIFGLHQGFAHFFKKQQTKHWDYRLVRSSRDVKIGLVGLGHTGEAIARMARALGLSVVACRSSDTPSSLVDKVYGPDQLHDMLGAVDVTVVCAALTTATQDMFNVAAFAAMNPGSYFINVARGKLVVEDALIAALYSGHLAGALIDVARKEPLPASDPLWDTPNLLITPHTCSDFIGWEAEAASLFADNLERFIAGQPLQNQVYSWRGY